MATIGILDVGIRAKTTEFERGMKRAMKTLNSFGSAFTSVLAATGIVMGFRAIESAVSRTMESIDKLAKSADGLGITTEQMAAFNLQADLAGVSTETLASNLGKMQKVLAETAMNGGVAEGVLKSMGLSAAQLVNMNPAQAFRQIADGIAKIQNPAQRAQAAMALFGKGGREMITMLSGGAAAFDEAQAKADAYGLSISRIDASMVEQANDAITEMKAAWEGVMQQLIVQLAPAIVYISGLFKEVAQAIVGNAAGEVEAFDLVAAALQGVANVVHFVRTAYYSLKGVVLSLVGTLISWGAQVNIFFNGIANSVLDLMHVVDKSAQAVLATAAAAAALDPTGIASGFVSQGQAVYDALSKPALAAADAIMAAKTSIDNQMLSMSQELIADAQNAAEQASAEYAKIGDGSVLKRLSEIRAQMEAVGLAAQQQAEFSRGGLFDPEVPDAKKKAAKELGIGSFAEIALSRTAIGGIQGASKKQEVFDKANEKQVGISQTIADTLAAIKANLQIG